MHDYADPVCIDVLAQLGESDGARFEAINRGHADPAEGGRPPCGNTHRCVMTVGGKERTKSGFRSIIELAGLKLMKVWRVPGMPGGCVEGCLNNVSRG
jgi:hypothetical protein